MTHIDAMKQALEYLQDNQHLIADNERHAYVMEYNAFIERLEKVIEQAEQEPVADREAFERHWKKVRGAKKSDRELKRHPLQPQTYIQDSANRHWVTWQAATRKSAHGIKE